MDVAKNHSLDEWLYYLEKLHPKTIDLGLERIRKVATAIHIFPWTIPTITVTGTNGKGSTVMLLEAIYKAAGYRVGTYISPHLLRYNERIRIDQQDASDEQICAAFSEIEKARSDISLTYFEFGTLAALKIFSEADLDIVVLEVGLGGRLDAVNIIDADIAVVTSIGLDHQEYLGHDREAIAAEKAGIMRHNKPCVCGDKNPPNSLIEFANKIAAPLYIQQQDFFYQRNENSWHWWNQNIRLNDLPLPAIYLENAATALQVIQLFDLRLTVNENAIIEGLKQVFIPGRQQLIHYQGKNIMLDVSHNAHAAHVLIDRLQTYSPSASIYVVFSMLEDKDILQTILLMRSYIKHWYIAELNVVRAASLELLQQQFQLADCQAITSFTNISQAFAEALQQAKEEDLILVCGSFHTVAEVLKEVYWLQR